MVRFWFIDVKKWQKIDGWLVRSEALEAAADGADGLRIVAPTGVYTNAAYVAAEAIENDDTSYKYWDDQFYSITEVCLDEKDY